MDRLGILAPALVPAAYMIIMLAVYVVRCAVGRPPEMKNFGRRRFSDVFGPYFTRYFVWLLQPIEHLVVSWEVSPNLLTVMSLGAAASAGLAIATSHLATAAWLYIVAGGLDVLDGRLARATNRTSRAGGFLDSVADRWGELFVFSGFAWFLRDSIWLLAVMLAVAGSVMVSYTRARGEGLGIKLDGGMMQRAERIALVSIGTLVTAWFDAARETAAYGHAVIGVALLITGVGASITAVHRWVQGYRILREQDEGESGTRRAEASLESRPAHKVS